MRGAGRCAPGSIRTSLWCGTSSTKPLGGRGAPGARRSHPPQRGTAEGLPLPGLRPFLTGRIRTSFEDRGGGPPYAAFLFCAENSAVVLQTLRSRCVELKLHPAQERGGAESQAAEELCRCLGSRRQGAVTELAVRLERKKTSREDLAALLERSRAAFSAALLLLYGQQPDPVDRGNRPISCEKLDKNTNYAHNRTIAEIPWRMRL